ncbi:MAG TPA: sigma-70 family RNA polymerase sigma factor [Candidatus Binataceae bacterium]|nr:sigma-70 family RNA polymerase sigma factor [Candidatus Binataceae bacterium]
MNERQNEFESVAMPQSRSLLRVARRLTFDPAIAEDLVQETFLRAWRGFDQFQPGTNARAWLFRILFNVFYARGRKIRSGPVLVPLQMPGRVAEQHSSTSFSLLDSAMLSAALDDLSEDHRTVILLAVVEGFTCRELADILSIPIGTVMSRLGRARRTLRESLTPSAPKLFRVQASAK